MKQKHRWIVILVLIFWEPWRPVIAQMITWGVIIGLTLLIVFWK